MFWSRKQRTFKTQHHSRSPNLKQPYPDLVKYKTVEILDIPDESIVEKYFEECFEFLDSSLKNGRVLVHCRVEFN
jgi:protein-tyrosine phosphatase